jgi:hypothetical protein
MGGEAPNVTPRVLNGLTSNLTTDAPRD